MPPRQKAESAVLPSLSDQVDLGNILIYGPQGTGKTTDMAMAANEGIVVFADAESGLKKSALKKRGVNVDNIRVHSEITYDALEGLYWNCKATLEADPDSIYAVCLDSTTEIQKLLLEQIVGKAVDKAARRGMERDPFFIDRPDWGVVTEQMRRLTRRFRDLPCHVVFGCLEKRDTDSDGAVVYTPALTPAYATDLMGYVDVILHTQVVEYDGKEFYVGTCVPVGKYLGKDRFAALPRAIVNPYLNRIVDYINGDLDEDTDPMQIELREARAREEGSSTGGSGEAGVGG